MGKNKIYLSIDDLHKLYGISPEVVKQIKKKRRKRRIKKQLKNSFGGVKSNSDFMQGSASVIDKLFVEKHFKTINDENRRLEAQPIPAIEQQNQKHLDFFNKAMDGIGSGDIKVTQNKTGISLKNPKLIKKRIPKKSKQVEEVDDEEVYEPPVLQPYINQLAGVSTRSMYRLNPDEVLKDLNDAFDVGGNNNGSDMFIAANNDDIPPNTPIVDENQKAIDAKEAQDAQDAQDALDLQEAKDAQDAQDAIDLQEAKDAQDAYDLQQAKDAINKEKVRFNFYTIVKLDDIIKTEKQKFPRNIKTKEEKYNYLKNLNLIPE